MAVLSVDEYELPKENKDKWKLLVEAQLIKVGISCDESGGDNGTSNLENQ